MTIRIAEARWPDDRATVESLFREYMASLAEDIGFQNPDESSPACRASMRGRAASC